MKEHKAKNYRVPDLLLFIANLHNTYFVASYDSQTPICTFCKQEMIPNQYLF